MVICDHRFNITNSSFQYDNPQCAGNHITRRQLTAGATNARGEGLRGRHVRKGIDLWGIPGLKELWQEKERGIDYHWKSYEAWTRRYIPPDNGHNMRGTG